MISVYNLFYHPYHAFWNNITLKLSISYITDKSQKKLKLKLTFLQNIWLKKTYWSFLGYLFWPVKIIPMERITQKISRNYKPGNTWSRPASPCFICWHLTCYIFTYAFYYQQMPITKSSFLIVLSTALTII